ncbi:MAG TPA: maleylpyruvate isomerase N-terminal domain-containing protein [Longimicrobiales bacterium]|nr:maleylpyruvate isomerase N-terminal domain-containing protein [Longimicrobiales bacterium]
MSSIVRTGHLFRPLHSALLELLRGLPGDAWNLQVGAGEWTVRDVAAHLLDGDLRRISVDRDGYPPPPPATPITGYGDLLEYLNGLNAQWANAARRISPRLLVELLETTGAILATLMDSATLDGDATFPVAWAGQQRSPMWLDIGREYTERWHHQDQVREATGAEPLTQPDLMRPVIEVSLLAVPHALASVERPDGTAVSIAASGPAGGSWHVVRRDGTWLLAEGPAPEAVARIVASDLSLARLLLHRLARDRIRELVETVGDRELTAALTRARAVMV